MKAWTVSELDNVVNSLKPLLGGRLQELRSSGTDFALGFYGEGRLLWLWIDFNPIVPVLLPWADLPLSVPQGKSPVQLFLRAHFMGQTLLTIERPEDTGRVVRLVFSHDRWLEVRLFPRGENLIASAEGKSVSFDKVRDLKTLAERAPEGTIRDLDQLRDEWLARRSTARGARLKTASDPLKKLENQIAKKQSALKKVEEELERKGDLPWREIGLWLKREQRLDVPDAWIPFVDKRRKLSWNIEQCFQKARDNERKFLGTERRRDALRVEIQKLMEQKVSGVKDTDASQPLLKPLTKGDVEARSLRLGDDLVAYAGKNAADNLKLLRKARPWDFWFHLQDRPGAHGILFRNKTTKVSDSALKEVVAWFVKTQFGSKWESHSGEKVGVLMAECRHVRPIKGDRLGRVHYAHERILIYKIP